jgi:cyclic beta-1,2-glucan synthetase
MPQPGHNSLCMTGDGDKACELFDMINPSIIPGPTGNVQFTRTEPYCHGGGCLFCPAPCRKGRLDLYTGTASWFYKAGLENILGFTRLPII